MTNIPAQRTPAEFLAEAFDAIDRGRTPLGPHQADVDALRQLLDLAESFSSNDQRARYILTSDWFRDHGASAGMRAKRA